MVPLDLDGSPLRAHSSQSPSQDDNLAPSRRAAGTGRRRGDQSFPAVSTKRAPNDKSNHTPRAKPSKAIFSSIRSELVATRSELERFRSDATKFAERYRFLKRDLEEANEAIRSRDKQIEDLKRERDLAMADCESCRSARDLTPDNDLDIFEGHSFSDRYSYSVVVGVPGKETPEGSGQDGLGEFDLEKVLSAERSIPPTLPTDVVANAVAEAFTRHPSRRDQHQPESFQHKLPHQRANVVRARPKKTSAPVLEPDHRHSDDHNEENINDIRGEGSGSDNCVNVDSGNHNGPYSTKTVSYITCCR